MTGRDRGKMGRERVMAWDKCDLLHLLDAFDDRERQGTQGEVRNVTRGKGPHPLGSGIETIMWTLLLLWIFTYMQRMVSPSIRAII